VRITLGFHPQKEDPNRVCITAGSNLIKTSGDLTTRAADLTTSKRMWNSILGTEKVKFVGFDISKFDLGIDMERYE
jgi:hypothetical protein